MGEVPIKKNGEIEFLRFIFASIIVIHHSYNLFDGFGSSIFTRGSFAVEFFFIVSGYLLMASVNKHEGGISGDLGQETVAFLKKKISSIYIELLVAYLIGISFVLVTRTTSLMTTLKLIITSIPSDLFFMGRTGIGIRSLNGPVWYISTMLICMLIMYPLLRKWKNVASMIIIPILSFACIGFLHKTTGSVLDPSAWIGFTFKGNIRGFGEIGFGIIAFYLVGWLRNLRLNKMGKLILTTIKWLCFGIIITWMMFSTTDGVQMLLLQMYVIGISIAFANNNCVDRKLFENKICMYLGKLSTPLFLCHFFFSSSYVEIANLKNVIPQNMSKSATLLLYYSVSVIVAAVVCLISDKCRERNFHKKITGLFTEKIENDR